MMIALFGICIVLSFAASIWALVIIFKRSIIGGLLSLFLGLPMLYFLVTGWGKEGEDIRKPFFLSLILYGVAIAIGVSMGIGAAKDMQDQLQQQMSAPPARSTPAFRETTPAAESVRTSAPAQAPSIPSIQSIPPQRTETRTETARPVQQTSSRPRRAQSDCVYKPVMTDEDMAKCR
jgi:hypothetical protein